MNKTNKLDMDCTIKEQIEVILDEFDFDRVLKVMKALNWKWIGDEWIGKEFLNKRYTPSLKHLKKRAHNLLYIAAGYGSTCAEKDGFMTTRDDETGCLSLYFVVEDKMASEYVDWKE